MKLHSNYLHLKNKENIKNQSLKKKFLKIYWNKINCFNKLYKEMKV